MIRNTKFHSFMGTVLYDHLVPKSHFLKRLNELIDWIDLGQGVFQVYKGGFRLGAGTINPITMLKMLLLGYMYDLSDRETERLCNETIPFKYFIEIAVDESAPDHSSLSVFRDRILKHYGTAEYFKNLFEKVIKVIAIHPEITFGDSQIIDATHIEAKVNAIKNDQNKEDGNTTHTDQDAKWGCKGSEKKKDEKGNTVYIPKWFFGYKKHSSIENKHRFVTSTIVTTGEKPDGNYFQELVRHDIQVREKPKGYYADKSYDDGEHHFFLNENNMQDGIILKETRLKDDERYAIWHMIANSQFYQQRKQERYKVEAMNADEKNNHRLGRCCYFGLLKTEAQCYLTDVVYNLKKMVKILYDTSPKSIAA